MVIASAAVASLAAGNAYCLYRFFFARQHHAWKLETAEDVQAVVLPSFRCPISQEVMQEPVVTCDGQTYERQNIQEWFRQGSQTSPLTNLPLSSKELVPNLALRQAVADFNAKVCPLLRQEVENRKRLEQRVEVLLHREAQLQQEMAGREGQRDEAMQALLSSLEDKEAEVLALREAKDDGLKDAERLRNEHQEELERQREEQQKALQLAEAAKEVALAESKEEANSLRRQRDNAVRIIQGLRRASVSKAGLRAAGPRATDLLEVDLGPEENQPEIKASWIADIDATEVEQPAPAQMPGGAAFRSASVDSALPKPAAAEPNTGDTRGISVLGRLRHRQEEARQRSSSATRQRTEKTSRSAVFRNIFRRPVPTGSQT